MHRYSIHFRQCSPCFIFEKIFQRRNQWKDNSVISKPVTFLVQICFIFYHPGSFSLMEGSLLFSLIHLRNHIGFHRINLFWSRMSQIPQHSLPLVKCSYFRLSGYLSSTGCSPNQIRKSAYGLWRKSCLSF